MPRPGWVDMAFTHEHQARWSLSGSSPWTVCCPRKVGSAHYHRRYVLGTTEPKTTPSGLMEVSPVLPFKQSEIGQIENWPFFFFSFFFLSFFISFFSLFFFSFFSFFSFFLFFLFSSFGVYVAAVPPNDRMAVV